MKLFSPAVAMPFFLVVILPAWLVSPSAHAQSAPVKPAPAVSKEPPPSTQQVVIKADGSYDARRDDTSSKIVVTQEEIRRLGDTTIGAVLSRLPGVTLGGVQGRGGDIKMRGLGNGYTQILLNGEPTPVGFSLDSISPDTIERVEILRGGSAEFSAQAIAGTINILLKSVVRKGQREIKAGLQSDHDKPGANFSFQFSDRRDPWSYAFGGGASYARFDRPSSFVTSGQDADLANTLLRHGAQRSAGSVAAINLSPRFNLILGPKNTLTSQSFLSASRYEASNDELISTNYGALPQYSGTHLAIDAQAKLVRTDLNWNQTFANEAKLDMKVGGNYNDRDIATPTVQFYDGNIRALDRLLTSHVNDHGLTTSGKYAAPVTEGHALVIGWDAARSFRDEDRIQRDRSTVGAPTVDLDQAYTAAVNRVALFAQDEWGISKQLSFYYGLRWEAVTTRSTGDTYSVNNRLSVWSPVLQVLYKVPGTKGNQVRIGVNRTYKAPPPGTLIPRRFAANNNSPTTPDLQGNPALRPELAWGLDLAYEHYLSNAGMLGMSAYTRRIENITRQQVQFMDGAWVAMPINDGRAITRGLEFEAKFPVRSFFKQAPAIDVRANLTRNWSRLEAVPGPDNRLDQQIPLSATMGLDYKADKLPLSMGGSYSFQNGGLVRISQAQFAYTIPKRVMDLYALWKFGPQYQLRVSLANILHQSNVVESRFVESRGSNLDDRVVTPTAVVARATLETKF